MRFTSVTQASESRSVTAGSLLLGFSIAYSTRSQLNTWFVHLLAQAVENLCSDPPTSGSGWLSKSTLTKKMLSTEEVRKILTETDRKLVLGAPACT